MKINTNQKAIYVQPSLQRLGSISSLTAGGSVGEIEMGGGMDGPGEMEMMGGNPNRIRS